MEDAGWGGGGGRGKQEILPWVCLIYAGFEDRSVSIFVHRGCIYGTVSLLYILYGGSANMNLPL